MKKPAPTDDSSSIVPLSYASFDALLVGEENPQLIDLYLLLPTWDVAPTQAIAADRESGCTSPFSNREGLEELLTKKQGLDLDRRGLVARMSFCTLLTLYSRLGVTDPFSDRSLDDPITRPIRERISEFKTFSEEWARRQPLAKPLWEKELTEVDSRSTSSRPTLPTSIIRVIRWAINPPKDALPAALKSCFRDFLQVRPKDAYRIPIDIDLHRLQLEEIDAKLDGRYPEVELDRSQVRNLRKEQKSISRTMEREITIQQYRADFVPGRTYPSWWEKMSRKAFNEIWNDKKWVTDERTLAWIALRFPGFWERHGKYYSGQAQALSEIGKRGSPTRDTPMWIDRTKGYVDSTPLQHFLAGNQSQDLLEYSIAAFAQQWEEVANYRTKIKLKKFLLLLAAHRGHKLNQRSFPGIRRSLREIGIKSVSDETFEECHRILQKAFNVGKTAKK